MSSNPDSYASSYGERQISKSVPVTRDRLPSKSLAHPVRDHHAVATRMPRVQRQSQVAVQSLEARDR